MFFYFYVTFVTYYVFILKKVIKLNNNKEK